QGDANKLWIVPSEMGKALEGLGGVLGALGGGEEETSDSGDEQPAKRERRRGAREDAAAREERKRKRATGAELTQAIEQLGAPPLGPMATGGEAARTSDDDSTE